MASLALLNYRPWGRTAVIILSVLRLFAFPLGTIFGVYSLWALLNSETKDIFDSQIV
jgi:hypothetical protein